MKRSLRWVQNITHIIYKDRSRTKEMTGWDNLIITVHYMFMGRVGTILFIYESLVSLSPLGPCSRASNTSQRWFITQSTYRPLYYLLQDNPSSFVSYRFILGTFNKTWSTLTLVYHNVSYRTSFHFVLWYYQCSAPLIFLYHIWHVFKCLGSYVYFFIMEVTYSLVLLQMFPKILYFL